MTKKDDNGKIGGISGASASTGIRRSEAIQQVSKAEKTSAVGKVGSVTDAPARRRTMLMSAEEREELFKMIEKEAKVLLKDAPESQREAVKESVKLAIEAGLLDAEDEDPEN
jgi:hypothetical protein